MAVRVVSCLSFISLPWQTFGEVHLLGGPGSGAYAHLLWPPDQADNNETQSYDKFPAMLRNLSSSLPSPRRYAATALAVGALALMLTGCGIGGTKVGKGKIAAVGAENQYASVISQIGGKYVQVSAIMSSGPRTGTCAPSASRAARCAP